MADRSRPKSKVSVELLSQEVVPIHNNFTVKDVYSAILKNTDMHVLNSKDYASALRNGKTKFYIENVTLIDKALVVTPSIDHFFGPASLPSTGDVFYPSIEIGVNNKGGVWSQVGQESVIVAPKAGNTISQEANSGASSSSTNTIRTSNIWDSERYPNWIVGIIKGWHDLHSGVALVSTRNDFANTIKSKFKIDDLAPIYVRAFFTDINPEQMDAMKQVAPILNIPQEFLTTPRIVVDRGSFKVVVFSNGRVSILDAGGNLKFTDVLPSIKFDNRSVHFSLYWLGSKLYIYAGVPSTDLTVAKSYISFDFGVIKNTQKQATVALQGGLHSAFTLVPIIHAESGFVCSPLISPGYEPDGKITNIGYIGKMGAAPRTVPIRFPDTNDTQGIFDYLRNTSIDLILDKIKDGFYSYKLTLISGHQNNKLSQFSTALNAEFRQIQKSIAENISKSKNGDITPTQAKTNITNQVRESTITGLSTLDRLFGNSNLGAYQAYERYIAYATDGQLKFDLGSNYQVTMTGLTNSINSFFNSDSVFDTHMEITMNGAGMLQDAVGKSKKSMGRSVNAAKAFAARQRSFSPAVLFSQIVFTKEPESVNMNPNPQIDVCDVQSISISQSVEQQSGVITLNNRKLCNDDQHGIYTYIPGENNFTGIKPIQVKAGFEGDSELKTVFTGYVTNREYSRSGSKSICNLILEDRSKKAKESFAVNLPFFDGWCQLAAIHYIARQAGYTDDEILLYQDPNSGEKIKISDLIEGDYNTLTGPCYDGHVNKKGVKGNAAFHVVLPTSILAAGDSPNYNFSFGTPLWSCMTRIREFTQWYLYANNFGNIIYGPPTLIIADGGVTFKEIDKSNEFTEILNSLTVRYDTANMRNMVFVQGQTFVPSGKVEGIVTGNWVPHPHIVRKPDFPNDINDASFAPWLRYAFKRSPSFENPARVALAASEMFRRVTRNIITADFSAWGRPELFPYLYIDLDESILNETGVNSFDKFVIVAHTLNIDMSDFQLKSSLSVESLDDTAIGFEQNMFNLT